MKRKWKSAVLILFYCVPWAFFAPWWDAVRGGMFGYLILLMGLGVLDWISVRTGQLWAGTAGNLCSGLFSCVMAEVFLSSQWDFYFKPLTAVQLTEGISAAALVVYFMVVYSQARKRKEN